VRVAHISRSEMWDGMYIAQLLMGIQA
jgi:hypothetical protein